MAHSSLEVPEALSVVRKLQVLQMIGGTGAKTTTLKGIVALAGQDVAEMRALADETRPGPFFERTHELGNFVGYRHEDELVAMAGERMQLSGFTEISAVCTRPAWRGRGLAGELMLTVWEAIAQRGDVPFLHVFADNFQAIRLYADLGFVTRAERTLHVLKRSSSAPS
jgi:predicted GNAT family acetyltransferase